MNELRTDRRQARRLAGAVLIAVALILVAAELYEPPIEDLLNAAIGPASGGLFAVRVDSASVSLLSRSVIVSGLEFHVVPEALGEARLRGLSPNLRPEVRIEQLRIRGFRLLPLLRQHALIADSIDVDAPHVELTLALGADGRFQAAEAPGDDPPGAPDPAPGFPEQVREALRDAPEIRIEQIRLRQASGSLRVVRRDDSEPIRADRVGRLDLEIEGLRIHHAADADEIANLFSRAIALSVEDVNLASGLSAARIRISTGERTLSVEGLRRDPGVSTEDYLARPEVREPDRIEATVSRIDATGVDPLRALSRGAVAVEAMSISGFDVTVLHDRHKPAGQPHRQWQPHDIIGALPVRLNVARIDLDDGRVTYDERVPEAQVPGRLTFESIRGSITGVDTAVVTEDPEQPVVAQLDTLLMGAAPVSLSIQLPLRQPAPTMRVEGRIATFDATSLNGILTPLLGMEISRGTVDGASLAIDYVPGRASGHLDIDYHDASLQMTDRDGGGRNVGRRVLSFLANQLAIHAANPARPGEAPRPGKIDVEIDETWPFFKLLWVPVREALLDVLKSI